MSEAMCSCWCGYGVAVVDGASYCITSVAAHDDERGASGMGEGTCCEGQKTRSAAEREGNGPRFPANTIR